MIILENIKLEIPEETGRDFLTKLMGGRLNPQIEKLLADKSEICIDNIEPKAIYSNYEIEKVTGDCVYFKSGNIFTGPNISKILTGSEVSTIFITTLGSKTDKIIKDTGDSGDMLSTIIMDAITTELLGILGNHVGEIIKKENIREKGWGSTCTYSPGQYKWTIEEQKEIFSMVDGNKIGVELNKSYLMVPFKSISGVYGFGSIDRIDKTRVACDLCPRENCIGRR
ncbi:MAG: hypothetical protein M1479_02405 [Actinobacteria bacterium]|nr:hypothetical protein [Actinomycetota bacterium]